MSQIVFIVLELSAGDALSKCELAIHPTLYGAVDQVRAEYCLSLTEADVTFGADSLYPERFVVPEMDGQVVILKRELP